MIGLRCKDGVVLAVEKLIISKLLVEGSNRRIYNVDRHAGVVSGLPAGSGGAGGSAAVHAVVHAKSPKRDQTAAQERMSWLRWQQFGHACKTLVPMRYWDLRACACSARLC